MEKTSSEKLFWRAFTGIGIVTGIIFIALIVNLVKRNDDRFTEEETEKATLPVFLKTDPMRGSQNPKLIITSYSNFACKNCVDTALTLQSVAEKYPEDVLLVWKDFPNTSLHPESFSAAVAARCAQNQKKFWPYHDYLMQYQRELGEELYLAIAEELALKPRIFRRCLVKEKTKDVVEEGLASAVDLELSGAPTIFLNAERFTGKVSLRDIELRLDLLKQSTP